jgi:CRP/FNR family cyclic AMP-dependent transcriptional regulator
VVDAPAVPWVFTSGGLCLHNGVPLQNLDRPMDTVPAELWPTPDFKDTSMHGAWADHPRSTQKSPVLAAAAIKLLRTPTALAQLSPEESACVVSFMRLVGFAAGTTVIREGDQQETGYMLLLLTGEVSVQTLDPGSSEPVIISVLGPGNVIGAMGLLDGAPRSASCVATSRIEAAVLSRGALDQLIEQHPQVGAKLMVALSQRLSDQLRATGQQIGMYVQLMHNMQQEIDALRAEVGDLKAALGRRP